MPALCSLLHSDLSFAVTHTTLFVPIPESLFQSQAPLKILFPVFYLPEFQVSFRFVFCDHSSPQSFFLLYSLTVFICTTYQSLINLISYYLCMSHVNWGNWVYKALRTASDIILCMCNLINNGSKGKGSTNDDMQVVSFTKIPVIGWYFLGKMHFM